METASTLARAQAGDQEAFRELTDPYRAELLAHCYQILGSVADAEDMLQETLLAAWRRLTSPSREGRDTRISYGTRSRDVFGLAWPIHGIFFVHTFEAQFADLENRTKAPAGWVCCAAGQALRSE